MRLDSLGDISAKTAQDVASKVAEDVATRTATEVAKQAAIDQEAAHEPAVLAIAKQAAENAGETM